MLNLSEKSEALEEGIFKFTHPSGVPFVVMGGEESKGIEGTLDPGKTQQLAVIFCPSKYTRMLEKYCMYLSKYYTYPCKFKWELLL